MRKLLLVIGIISFIACALSLGIAAFNWLGYNNLMDGSPELYSRLHSRMIFYFAVGAVLALVGIVCVVIRLKK